MGSKNENGCARDGRAYPTGLRVSVHFPAGTAVSHSPSTPGTRLRDLWLRFLAQSWLSFAWFWSELLLQQG